VEVSALKTKKNGRGRLELNGSFDGLFACETVGSITVSYRASVSEALNLRYLLAQCHG
jgi:hypothetical protein